MSREEWRDYPSCPFYQVSNLGRVRSKDRDVATKDGRAWHQKGRLLAPAVNKLGRVSVRLSEGGRKWSVQVSHMVAESFLGPREGRAVRHYDDNPTNNTVENLRYGTQGDNIRDSVRNGSNRNVQKTHCPQGHSYSGPNLVIESTSRACRACRRARSYASHRKDAQISVGELADELYERLMKGVSNGELLT